MKTPPKPEAGQADFPQAADSSSIPQPAWIDNARNLVDAARIWQQRGVIGLDTEFVRERTFFARPGLVQISDGDRIWLLDPLAIDDFGPLAALLKDPGITKILHSVGEDLEILIQLAGQLPTPLFDTQIAAAMLGAPLQRRYEDLVGERLGIELAGGKARSDWTRRPLADGLLTYAAQDVLWLPALHQQLVSDLTAAGRLDWLEEDCQRLVDSHQTTPEPDLAYLRIKGAGRLTDDQLQRLKRLAAWREHQAIDRDLPRGFILKDPVLLALVRNPPEDVAALAALRDLPRPVARRHGSLILELLGAPLEKDFQRPPELCPLTASQREQLEALQNRVRETAGRLDIDPALVASKRVLVYWIQTGRGPIGEGWRKSLLGL